MEEACVIRQCYDECNKDHLATTDDGLNARENNSKRWLVCGFNGFTQLKVENKWKLPQFEEIRLPCTNECADILAACSWNCLAIGNGCSLHLHGFVINRPKTIKTITTKVSIKCLDICDKYCLVLLENGKVYKLLLGSEDELKEIKFQASLNPITPQKRSILGDNKTTKSNMQIVYIACGNNITIAISATNAVFSGTTQIYQFPKHQHIKQLKCGFEHVLLLTSNGDIYAWGNGLRGQLGLEFLRIEETPTMIEGLAGIKITDIAAGGWHSAAISAFGDLYTWGFNSNGQLGLRLYKISAEPVKEPSVYPLPQLIEITACPCSRNSNGIEDSCYPIKVAAGGRHTVLQMNCGSINACGWNSYGQLGLKMSRKYCDYLKFVLKLEDENHFKSTQIICGDWCTLLEI